MAYFSNGTEGQMYEERYCNRCVHRDDEYGCPIWNLHFAYVGEKRWQTTLDRLIPMVPKKIKGLGPVTFPGQCVAFQEGTPEREAEPPLRPGQQKALEEWRARGHGAPASPRRAARPGGPVGSER